MLGALIGVSAPLLADTTDPYSDYREQSDYNEAVEVPWVELETKVKTPPGDNLDEAQLASFPRGMTLYLDMDSIEIGDDYVVRAWLVAKSRSGAYNASYEGLYCAERQYKVYAYYNPKRSKPLREVNLPQWREARRGRYRHELMEQYLCSGARPEPVNEIADNLRKDAASYDSPY
jgi:hypothetical protein